MYVKIRKTCGAVAALATVAYLTVLILSITDGPDGLEMPIEVARVIVTGIAVLLILSAGGWLFEQIVRAALNERAGILAKEMRLTATQLAATTRAVTIAECRALLRDDVTEVIEAGLKRAETYGMVREATSRAGHVNGSNGATVHALWPGEES